ncbi:MAG: sodium-dependent transporter [Pseudomonadota bacterium]|nr:sodium-dependent transporter [Pseudomonadota bacterium]
MVQRLSHQAKREQWGTKLGFVFAAMGSAVGLGNIWRFPYVVGENGGGAFILVYVACIIICGLPIMLGELVIGRTAQSDAVGSFGKLAPRQIWSVGGLLGVLAGFFILSFYSVVAGWALKYLFSAVGGSLWEVNIASHGKFFGTYISEVWEPLIWQGAMMVATVVMVARGVRKGLEQWNRVLIPILATLVLVLAGYSMSLDGAVKGIAFLFAPDWEKLLEPEIYIIALGQAFFSLSIGMAVFITYGSYLSPNTRLPTSAGAIATGDTVFAIVAGLAIFPAVFAFGLSPSAGPGLSFIVLPELFQTMPFGEVIGILFFLLLVFAALTSMASLLEVPVSFFMRIFDQNRLRTTFCVGFLIYSIGIPSSLGFGVLNDVKWGSKSIIDVMEFFTLNLALPIGGMLTALFVGWAWHNRPSSGVIGFKSQVLGALWLWSLRIIAPITVCFVFLRSLDLI